MSSVATVFKVYVESGKEQEVSDSIRKTLNPKAVQTDEVAFGIKVLKVMFVHEDSEGSTALEDGLRKIGGVTEVEVEDESLL